MIGPIVVLILLILSFMVVYSEGWDHGHAFAEQELQKEKVVCESTLPRDKHCVMQWVPDPEGL